MPRTTPRPEPGDHPGRGPGADAPAASRRTAVEPAQAFAELGRIPLAELGLSQVMQRVAELAQATIPGADEVSVTLIEDGRPSSVAFTGDLAVALDERQYERGFGPCTDAAMSGSVVSIPDVEADGRYPDFGRQAARAGVHSSLSVGMPVPQRTVGGLNVYSRRRDAFDDAARQVAQVFADYAAVALVNASMIASTTALARQMEQAMATRASIEQAKGILMGRLGIGPDEAFTLLVQQSQQANRKLQELAAQLVQDVRDGRRRER